MNDPWLVRPATTRILWGAFALALAAIVIADLFVEHHPELGVGGTFGFGAWFGFLSCVGLVVAARAIGLLLRRPDTYYDD